MENDLLLPTTDSKVQEFKSFSYKYALASVAALCVFAVAYLGDTSEVLGTVEVSNTFVNLEVYVPGGEGMGYMCGPEYGGCPNEDKPCCGTYNWCGDSEAHCTTHHGWNGIYDYGKFQGFPSAVPTMAPTDEIIHPAVEHVTSGSENSRYLVDLEKHDIQCNHLPINHWRLEQSENGNVFFNYECLQVEQHVTTQTDTENGQAIDAYLISLEKQSAYCPNDAIMTRWHGYNRDGDFGIEFSCNKYDVSASICKDYSTTPVEAEERELSGLASHNIQCPADEGLNGFEGSSNGDGKLFIEYRCCSLVPKAPTPAPTHTPAPTVVAPLFCPVELKEANKVRALNIREGCVVFADHDIAAGDGLAPYSDYTTSKALFVCSDSEVELTRKQLNHYGLFDDISYMNAGTGTYISYFSGEDFDGDFGEFRPGGSKFVHRTDSSGKLNDVVQSVIISAINAGNVPSDCKYV